MQLSSFRVTLLMHGIHVGQVQLGDYLGRPEELPVAAMHAYIDAERYAGLSLDEALRALLQGFRLPGALCCWVIYLLAWERWCGGTWKLASHH